MKFCASVVLTACVLTGVAEAQSKPDLFCDGLAGLVGSLKPGGDLADQSFALPDNTDAQAGCRTSLALGGGKSQHCMWTFSYRAGAAKDAFAILLDKVTNCGFESAQQDLGVNHPDYYDLRVFGRSGGEVSISLKDKGALQQTLVFLTVSAP